MVDLNAFKYKTKTQRVHCGTHFENPTQKPFTQMSQKSQGAHFPVVVNIRH